MTVEELLKPRYKVIALWPHSEKDGWVLNRVYDVTGIGELGESQLNKFPHLFKPLQWYHDRTRGEIELVEYVKWVQSKKGIIGKVIEWRQGHLGWECRVEGYPGAWNPSESNLTPATKEEYETFKTLKQ